MHDLAFADALRPEKFTVLGLKLVDYTIGHELFLQRERNALVVGGFEKLSWVSQAQTLRHAALHCCRRKPVFLKRWDRRRGQYMLKAEVETFQRYRMACSSGLPLKEMPRRPNVPYRYFGGPQLARLINYVSEYHKLLIETHFEGSPLNFPLGLAEMLHLTHSECSGEVWIQNLHDVQELAQREKFEREHPESTLAVGDDAVQAALEEWNREHPDAQVPLLRKPDSEKQKSKAGGRN